MKTTLKILEYVFLSACALLDIWFFVSWAQIAIFNLSADPFSHYSAWNFFLIFFH